MNIINLTPHDIVLMNDNGETLKVFESQGVARLSVITERGKSFILDDGTKIPTSHSLFGEVEGLPRTNSRCILYREFVDRREVSSAIRFGDSERKRSGFSRSYHRL